MDRPIIFSAPMIRALMERRKTHTRRIIKDVPPMPAANCHPSHAPRHPEPYLDAYCGERPTAQNPRGMGRDWHWWQVDDRLGPVAFRLPYAPGDRLYVREAFITGYDIDDEFGRPVGDRKVWYRATDHGLTWYDPDSETTLDNPPWKSSIHMPRWASRLTLTVTDVRVQRLQEISEADARAEGCIPDDTSLNPNHIGSARAIFAALWNSLHGPDAWDANPWVAAISFTVRKGNIDATPKEPTDD